MQIAIDRRAGAPVNRQIAEQVRQAIEGGRLAPGERLPTIRDLARKLGVNRDTVASAYERLAGDGVIESTVGRGTFVAEVRPSGSGATSADALFSPPVERLLAFERTRPVLAEGADVVPMHALVPEPSLYPAAAFRESLNRALDEGGAELLLYGSPQGHPALREALAERLAAGGIAAGAKDLVLCHGASQGISLAVRLFAGAGDAVAVEEPTYNNVLGTLYGLGIRPVPVPMHEGGPDLEALERVLQRPEVKLFYTIPTFHNPMGISTSLPHRRNLLAVAARCGKPLVEDAFEMDLAEGRPVPPLAALDAAGLVVHLFSFSKSLFPGARVGSVLARGRAVEALLALKRASDLSDAMPLQAALADFLASGAYDRHLVALRRVLAARRNALLAALEEHMPPGTRWTRPDGGYQIWVEFPDRVDTGAMLADAGSAGVLYAPGYQFYCDGRSSSAMRLTVAMADEKALRRGAATLGELARRRLDQTPRQEQAAAVHV